MYIQTHINENVFRTKVLTNNKDIQLGMMGKKFTSQFDALLFVMNSSSCSFWMKNCIVPLDVIFIENGKITKIHHNCQPCPKEEEHCETYEGNGNLVIEMPGGTCKKLHIRKGNVVIFSKK
uniref:DUF192 domain-containing protein n=1 Tax=viral metagenome TaxID=1070528 RepID=A0A6C0IH56_9ZZZZ